VQERLKYKPAFKMDIGQGCRRSVSSVLDLTGANAKHEKGLKMYEILESGNETPLE